MWILAFILCFICPPLGGLMIIILGIGSLSTKEGRQKYCKDSSAYYRRRYHYFKKTYGI